MTDLSETTEEVILSPHQETESVLIIQEPLFEDPEEEVKLRADLPQEMYRLWLGNDRIQTFMVNPKKEQALHNLLTSLDFSGFEEPLGTLLRADMATLSLYPQPGVEYFQALTLHQSAAPESTLFLKTWAHRNQVDKLLMEERCPLPLSTGDLRLLYFMSELAPKLQKKDTPVIYTPGNFR